MDVVAVVVFMKFQEESFPSTRDTQLIPQDFHGILQASILLEGEEQGNSPLGITNHKGHLFTSSFSDACR